MHIRKVEITHIKAIRSLTWDLGDRESLAGWHVVIGDNASGKTTFLQAIALALVTYPDLMHLNVDSSSYLARGASIGRATLWVQGHLEAQRIATEQSFLFVKEQLNMPPHISGAIGHNGSDGGSLLRRSFFASFGAMRRLQGINSDYEHMFKAFPRVARHLSLFKEDVAFVQVEEWLQQLRFQELEGEDSTFFTSLTTFINQEGLLPNQTRLESVSSKGVFFKDPGGASIKINDLSDGFRSVLALTFELIRQLEANFGSEIFFEGEEGIKVAPSGVVLIDEVDAHLHPTWQREIGFWFTRYFPKIQFIVTTHSPLVCQAAEKGSIFRLADLDGSSESGFIEGEDRLRLLRGNILAAYSTEAFGAIQVSPKSREISSRLAELSAQEFTRDLTEEEIEEIEQLKKELPRR